jgi:hypothetical protein
VYQAPRSHWPFSRLAVVLTVPSCTRKSCCHQYAFGESERPLASCRLQPVLSVSAPW